MNLCKDSKIKYYEVLFVTDLELKVVRFQNLENLQKNVSIKIMSKTE